MTGSADHDTASKLTGQRILIVEDEMLLAMDLQALLEEQGCEIAGPVPSVRRALDVIADQALSAATLDMNLNGESSAEIAVALRQRNIPFIVVSGYSEKDPFDPRFRDAPVVQKPFYAADLLHKLALVLQQAV